MTKQLVYIARKEQSDPLGETFVVIGVEVETSTISGPIADFKHLLRKEVLASALNIPTRPVIDTTKINMQNNYNITNIPDREVVEIINEFIESGNIVRTDLGNLVPGTSFFEDHIGVYNNSSGVFHPSIVLPNVGYERSGEILTITLANHGLVKGDVISIENPRVVGFSISDPTVLDDGEDNIVTQNTFNIKVTNRGKTTGNDLSIRVPSGVVKSINKYKYKLPDSYELIQDVNRYDHESGSVSINNIGNPIEISYEIKPNNNKGTNIGNTFTEVMLSNGHYLFRVKSGTLRTGVYEIKGNKVELSNTVGHIARVRSGDSAPETNGLESGVLEYVPVSVKVSSSRTFTPTTRILRINFTNPHRIFDGEYLITNLDHTKRLKLIKFSDNVIDVFVPSEITTIPQVIEIYKDTSEQIPQMLEIYIKNSKVRFKTLRELRNDGWDPSSRIDLPSQIDEDEDDPQLSAPSPPTKPDNFNFFQMDPNGNGTPIQKYQIADLTTEIYGSEIRGMDSLRLTIDTSITARSGVYRDYHTNGHLKIRSQYNRFRVLGVLDGPYEEFFENGETRVAFSTTPLHQYNREVLMLTNGLRILITLNNHNIMVGDSVLINNTLYIVDECPTPDQFYIIPPSLTNRLGGIQGLDVFTPKNIYLRVTYSRSKFTVKVRSSNPHNMAVGMSFYVRNATGGVRDGQYTVKTIVNSSEFEFDTPTNGSTSGGFDVFLFFTRLDFITDETVFRTFNYTISGTTVTGITSSPHFLRPGMRIEIANPTGGLLPGQYTVTGFSQDGLGVFFETSTQGIQGGVFDLIIPTNGYFSDGKFVRRATQYVNDIITNSVVVSSETATAVFGRSVIHGSYIEFHKTSAFKIRCNYDMGIIQGELIQWDEEGNREYVADFDRGNLKNRQVLNYTFTY